MPLSKYNRFFGGEKGSASKAHASMVEQYGPEKGERVFYATVNKKKPNPNPSPTPEPPGHRKRRPPQRNLPYIPKKGKGDDDQIKLTARDAAEALRERGDK